MEQDSLKLTAYFGERDRVPGAFLADRLLDLCERHALRTSVLLRGVEGFGIKHRVQTQRLLTLSEDLPIVVVAVDARARIEAALPEFEAAMGDGLLTLERARMVTDPVGPLDVAPGAPEAAKLTIYCGRGEPVKGLVDLLGAHGVAGATVLLGVDGTAHGERRRARFFAHNAGVPLMVIAVGEGPTIAAVLPHLRDVLERPLATLERVRVCRRDGEGLAEPPAAEALAPRGELAVWQKLMVYTSEQARSGREPVHLALLRRLRSADAAGATVLRGQWGYHGDHAPHGDRALSLRRHGPVVTIVVDAPERMARLWPIVEEATAEAGLVTSELVPAFRATGPDIEHGGLRLAGTS